MPDIFNPEMLVRARESRRMTQKELAASTHISQAFVSKVESARLAPSSEQVERFATALGYPRSLFYQDGFASALPVTFFRKRASFPATDAKAIVANLSMCRMHVERLARSVELPPANVSSVDRIDGRPTASDVARELRVAWKLPRGPIENLTAVLEDAGIIIVPTDFGADGIFGVSVYERRSGMPPIIFVSSTAPVDRLRFTMVHELAHVLLHHHVPIPSGACEEEADEFASEFLMPAEDIETQLAPVSLERLAQLKMHWRVSMGALLMRAETLDRVSTSRARQLWAMMNRLGYKTREPVALQREEPALIHELVRVHLEDLGYSEDELAAAVHLRTVDFREKYLPARGGLRLVR